MRSKTFLTLLAALFLSLSVQAQRVAVVDINEILSEMSDYQKAQTDLDRIASEWRQEIAQEYDEIKSLYNKYQAEQVLLSDDARIEREEEIMQREAQVRDLQKQKFGPEGELFLKRQELVSPIQEKVFTAIESFAADRGFDIVFDKSGSGGILFTSDEYDKTEIIKKRLGIR